MFFAVGDTAHAVEYYAGYITEKALSVDNLFVFLVIMASFKVPREYQQKVLLFGITFALISHDLHPARRRDHRGLVGRLPSSVSRSCSSPAAAQGR